jgi:hypothetical protein
MLGYRAKNNDVYVFFEPADFRGGTQKIFSGKIITNNFGSVNELEFAVDDEICRRAMDIALIRARTPSNPLIIDIIVMEHVYTQLKETGSAEPHLGYAHLCLRDVARMKNPTDILNYNECKEKTRKK